MWNSEGKKKKKNSKVDEKKGKFRILEEGYFRKV